MSRQDECVVTISEGRAASGVGKRRRPWLALGLGGAPDEDTAPAAVEFEVKLLDECGAMLRYASTRGMEIPPRAAYAVRELDTWAASSVGSYRLSTIVLGLIAGMILAMLRPDVLNTSDEAADFSPPLLALLGGFSAPAVYGIVSRLVDAVGTLVGGDPRDQAAAEVQEAVTRVKLASEQDRRRIAGRAFRIGDDAARVLRIDDPTKRDEAVRGLRAEIADMMNDLVPEIGTDPH